MAAYVRYIKKIDPFIEAWEKLLDETRFYNGYIVCFSESIQAKFYRRVCENIGFKSHAVGHLSRFEESWEEDQKTLQRIDRVYPDVQKAIRGLAGREWDGKTNLQQIYASIQEQIKWIADTIKFIRQDLADAQRLGNQNEINQIRQVIEREGPRLQNIYAFYQDSLRRLEQLDARLAGRA